MTTSISQLRQGGSTSQPSRSGFNVEAWHAMQARDEQLIRDSVLHGYSSRDYIYSFPIGGNNVTGISVVGARELASKYGGIKSRIVASVDKTGSLFVFKSFEPLAIQVQTIPQLEDEDDFYEVVMEITDVKTGNSIQVRKKETKTESKRNGETYQRPHYDVIAESKAFRNGVLSIIPQNVISEFEKRCLSSGGISKEKTINDLRDGVVATAAKFAFRIDRKALNELTYAEICGLGNALNMSEQQFKEAAYALGIEASMATISHEPLETLNTLTGEILQSEVVTTPLQHSQTKAPSSATTQPLNDDPLGELNLE